MAALICGFIVSDRLRRGRRLGFGGRLHLLLLFHHLLFPHLFLLLQQSLFHRLCGRGPGRDRQNETGDQYREGGCENDVSVYVHLFIFADIARMRNIAWILAQPIDIKK